MNNNIKPYTFLKNIFCHRFIGCYGIKDTIMVNGNQYTQEMAAIPVLSDFEIANIMNYIHSSWGNNMPFVTLAQVKEALDSCTIE